ncbi:MULTISPECIES: carboxymuconolactone decarboxylase family protein [Mesorhizobium]|uniref:carboxymuconolactone decarboxylase family protein n=1 Tax=Mesorhizobium sp. TaxID=1871066 RepID=UPI000494943E|nr:MULTISPECIES: carboxymuconolactone decarboxylase family protein [Mesorhizobium]RWM69147.1 MAG: carboxymuconolactone decarboxylase family protein [Mesorhizobium sp.]TIO20798.1 MAG: carboxymuconolactone decarboxylase family protein [Mesorhizobium sp.]TJV55143.1 MAG: carboxymuconolactone decarboxylase family protein [Mesorhizobium sp.]
MSRIPTPATINDAPEASRPVLETIEKQIGSLPNIFRLVSNSTAALNGLTALQGALGKGKLAPATRERIALTMAEANGCDYCLSAHTYTGAKFARLDESEIEANRRGTSKDPKAAAAVEFARALVGTRGSVAPDEIEKVRAAGYGDAEILEIIAHVALNTFTNYVNEALGTEIDFPRIDRLAA